MKVKHVEVLPDTRSPGGTCAIIKLHGVSRLDGPPSFRLGPAAQSEQRGFAWPKGDLRPLAVRAGHGSVEMLVGPDIAKAAALEAGAPVRLRMTSLGLDTEVIWPDLSPGLTSSRRVAKPSVADVPTVESGPQQTHESTGMRSSELSLTPPLDVSQDASISSIQPSAESATQTESRSLSRLKRRRPGVLETTLAHPNETSVREPVSAPAVINPPPLPTLPTKSQAVAVPSGYRQRVAEAQAAEAASHRARAPRLLPSLLAIIIVGALSIALLRITAPAQFHTLTAGIASDLRTAVFGRTNASDNANLSAVISRILSVDAQSPNGGDTSELSKRQTLEKANQLLADAKTPAQRAEAALWLRRALARTLSEPRMVWAVTQLGAAYATASAGHRPDYEAAHLLWTWAAAAGDPAAACFLGKLYTKGLGTAVDMKRAAKLFERARQSGGCPKQKKAAVHRQENLS